MRAIPALGLSLIVVTVLAVLAIAATPAQAQIFKYVEGTHYQLVPNPTTPKNPEKVEVMEFFWYGCPHCNQFQPILDSWKKKMPSDVDFKHTPAMWNKRMITHARMFYTSKALRLDDKMHVEFFDAMHKDRKKLTSDRQIYSLFEKHGVKEDVFEKTFKSFGIKSQVQQASGLAKAYGVTGTPVLVVNGKYMVSSSAVGTHQEALNVVNFLIAKERVANKS